LQMDLFVIVVFLELKDAIGNYRRRQQ
jgi:hypothetical protein